MKFDNRTTEFIALGASVAANCQSCVEYHAAKAREYGVNPDEVAQAVEIGRAVRAGAAAKIDALTEALLHKEHSSEGSGTMDGCGCGGWPMQGRCPM